MMELRRTSAGEEHKNEEDLDEEEFENVVQKEDPWEPVVGLDGHGELEFPEEYGGTISFRPGRKNPKPASNPY